MLILCIDACVGCVIPRVEDFRGNGGGNPDFKTRDLPLLCNSKTKQNLRLSSKAKL